MFFCLCVLTACKQKQPHDGEQPIARVFDHKLYAGDIEGLIGPKTTTADSAIILHAYVENWARDKMLLNLAKKNMPEDINIDRLVEDYRSALILNSYKESLYRNRVDTTLTEEELTAYYEENKQLYPLKNTLLRCIYVKIERDAEDVSKLKRWWKYKKDEGIEPVRGYVLQKAQEHLLDENRWYTLEEIATKMPKGTLDDKYSSSDQKDYYIKDRDYRYFLIIKEAKFKNDPSPYDFVKDDLAKILMKKKSIDLVKQVTEETYRKELENKNIEIF